MRCTFAVIDLATTAISITLIVQTAIRPEGHSSSLAQISTHHIASTKEPVIALLGRKGEGDPLQGWIGLSDNKSPQQV